MSDHPSDRQAVFRAAVDRFLQERLDTKLDKLAPDDPKRETLVSQYQRTVWLEDAARRVSQIQQVTHTLKPIHPDARGTNLYRRPDALRRRAEVGSHSMRVDYSDDVVGNAAALDVYKFLKLSVNGSSLLEWMLRGDPDVIEALSPDPENASEWLAAFTGVTQSRSDTTSSHTLAKQLLWLTGDDPLDDRQYDCLAPLYASSLAHTVFTTLNRDRFGEEAQAARRARREGSSHETGYREYPDLAAQKFGGSKPQNISQLNSERGGTNYLLGSLPPTWDSQMQLLPKAGQTSIFDVWARQLDVWLPKTELRKLLNAEPGPTMQIRDERDVLTDRIVDMILVFAGATQRFSPGWTQDATYSELEPCEKLWLDPYRCELDEEFRRDWKWWDWPQQVCDRFGNWLNGELKKRLPMTSVEHGHWSRRLARHPDWQFELDQLKQWLTQLEKQEVRL